MQNILLNLNPGFSYRILSVIEFHALVFLIVCSGDNPIKEKEI